ncbi:hypothetical protein QWY28_20165 [Nocardioides sp. SOB77]|uniref:Transposase n=1 Tax=Nocardioides oceani TaxID=3058369 RepID=A0ABT8FKT3_9ACTN|nr:hypothetical protein [Nocardioides oceani]MDN4175291.1 hypothetical protein [Nocardioides oceani]
MVHVAPPGWPADVRPPDAPDWERTAVGWLLDQCPPEYRGHAVLRRHPVALARLAGWHVDACRASARHGLTQARTALRDALPADVVEATIAVLLAEEARLAGVERAVGLVEAALRGRRFPARMPGLGSRHE